MFKTKILIPVIFLVLLVVLVVVDHYAPKPINWQFSLSAKEKIPYGSYLLYRFLPELFPGKNVSTVYDSLYATLKDREFVQTNYIIITNQFAPDALDVRELMKFVAKGNYVFIAAQAFGREFYKELPIKTRIAELQESDIRVNLVNSALKTRNGYLFEKGSALFYASSFDKDKTILLGTSNKRRASYIKIPHGKGCILLHTIPYAFTNYYLLKPGLSEYACKVLSYLPVTTTLWDEYYKPNNIALDTPLRFILSNASLKTAYYLAFCSLMLFILFKVRRTQRVIPEIKPLANDTLDFLTTIGRLYYQQADHKNIAEKKIRYFNEYLHAHCFLKVTHFSEASAVKIATKVDVPEHEVKDLFSYIVYIRNSATVSEYELVHLNTLMYNFYQKVL